MTRALLRAGVAGVAAYCLAACGGGGGSHTTSTTTVCRRLAADLPRIAASPVSGLAQAKARLRAEAAAILKDTADAQSQGLRQAGQRAAGTIKAIAGQIGGSVAAEANAARAIEAASTALHAQCP